MSNSNGIITAPVSISDVQTVLNEGSNDLATLCLSTRINRWAKYKPERWAGTTSQQKLLGWPQPMDYASRKINNFSLEVPYCHEGGVNVMNSRVHDFVYNYGEEGWSDIWNYLRPRGNLRTAQVASAEFYRLSDFAKLPSDTQPPTGYNHNARVPFNVSMDKSGCRFYYDGNKDIWVYEINIQVANKLNFVFFNSIGDDLHLQDFVTIPSDASSINDNTVAWRPIIQVFNDYTRAGEDEWYERTDAQYEIAGDAITSDPNSTWQVAIDLEDSNFITNQNQYYHVCVGIGLCNKSVSTWGNGDKVLFLPPYTQEQFDLFELPFYYVIKPVSYSARKLNVTALQFFAGGITRWVDAGGTAPYFTIHSLANGAIGLTMNITKLSSQSVDFVSQYGSAQTTGALPLRIQAREMRTGVSGETTLWLTPSIGPSNWATTTYIPVPSGNPEETVQLYATLSIGSIPVGGYGEYHLYATTNDSDYVNIGYFSIQKIQYTS